MTLAEGRGPAHRSATGSVAVSSSPHRGPELPFLGLDVLWLQVGGTICNIACRHCFITCGPKNDSHPFLSTPEALAVLDAARELGVKEYYFTGGEPFLHPDIFLLIERTLLQGPLSILTNGILIEEEVAARLSALSEASPYGLDLRISLDGTTEEENDSIRGRGTFEDILAAARRLAAVGLHPIFTVTTVHAHYGGLEGRSRFLDSLHALGFPRPRIKFIPPFQIGREARRTEAYDDLARLEPGDLFPGEEQVLQCGTCRTVTSRGVYPCPILIEEEGARMAGTLTDALRPIQLNHPACRTCHVEGFTCRT